MGKISFQPVAGQKLDKEDHDGDKTEILIPHPMLFCTSTSSRISLTAPIAIWRNPFPRPQVHSTPLWAVIPVSGYCLNGTLRLMLARGSSRWAARLEASAKIAHQLTQDDDDLVLPLRPRKSALNSVCCMTFGLVMFMAGLVLASIYVYRYYFIPHNPQLGYSELCRVIYDVDDPEYGELRRLLELEENVDIYLDENYEKISVPVPHFGGSDPADIIHDFHRGLTAYHDIALDKCYVIELNTTIVMPPRNFWELLNNVKKGTYLPQTYIIHEEMVVTGKVHDMRLLGPFIYRLCSGKETYRLSRRLTRRRINKRDAKDCHHIRHFENTFVVETVICDEA
ncbi:hypothetical protein JOQ06_017147 [Pogonophryne albipinna]|uniref:Integral membrane protein 2 n=1 Tax=Pogonophryne albipinna TaxID=1090488 RepID=A0AAD6FIV2_9TELE|nr:hypothetical protein JOQ06_017147 [Pogonophryne albipinna]